MEKAVIVDGARSLEKLNKLYEEGWQTATVTQCGSGVLVTLTKKK